MAEYKALFHILKSLQIDENRDGLPQRLLDQVIEFTGAQKGFIVVQEHGSFHEKYQVRFDRNRLSALKRKFSRSLVREAIRSREIVFSHDLSEDRRFADATSVAEFGRSSILVAPLGFKNDVLAVVYLEREPLAGPFDQNANYFMKEFVEIAGFALHKALKIENLEQFKRLHERDFLARYNFEGIITRHPKMIRLLEAVAQVAQSDATVLIRGETGTGKELIAKALYLNSKRAHRPFATLHCGALPESLFESELFGHKRGAFTGASSDRIGRISQASEGTLFIDEVAEIPLPSQAKLLRFFQFGEFQRIGSDHVEHVDVRIVAATHRNLEEMIEQGAYRQDLYYRLNVLELEIPPLRERLSDIPLLTAFFLKQYWPKKDEVPELSTEAAEALEQYQYPGNVRELAHVLERACVLAREPVIGLDLLPKAIKENYRKSKLSLNGMEENIHFSTYSNQELKAARDAAGKIAVEKVELAYLQGLLAMHDGQVAKAAKAAGMQRTYLYRLIAKYKDRLGQSA